MEALRRRSSARSPGLSLSSSAPPAALRHANIVASRLAETSSGRHDLRPCRRMLAAYASGRAMWHASPNSLRVRRARSSRRASCSVRPGGGGGGGGMASIPGTSPGTSGRPSAPEVFSRGWGRASARAPSSSASGDSPDSPSSSFCRAASARSRAARCARARSLNWYSASSASAALRSPGGRFETPWCASPVFFCPLASTRTSPPPGPGPGARLSASSSPSWSGDRPSSTSILPPCLLHSAVFRHARAVSNKTTAPSASSSGRGPPLFAARRLATISLSTSTCDKTPRHSGTGTASKNALTRRSSFRSSILSLRDTEGVSSFSVSVSSVSFTAVLRPDATASSSSSSSCVEFLALSLTNRPPASPPRGTSSRVSSSSSSSETLSSASWNWSSELTVRVSSSSPTRWSFSVATTPTKDDAASATISVCAPSGTSHVRPAAPCSIAVSNARFRRTNVLYRLSSRSARDSLAGSGIPPSARGDGRNRPRLKPFRSPRTKKRE